MDSKTALFSISTERDSNPTTEFIIQTMNELHHRQYELFKELLLYIDIDGKGLIITDETLRDNPRSVAEFISEHEISTFEFPHENHISEDSHKLTISYISGVVHGDYAYAKTETGDVIRTRINSSTRHINLFADEFETVNKKEQFIEL